MYIDTAIVTHTRLTTITCMRTFCSILPVGSRSRLRSYMALTHPASYLGKVIVIHAEAFARWCFINPRHMCEGYGSRFVCVCLSVCLSVTALVATYLVCMSKLRHHRVPCRLLKVCIMWISLKIFCLGYTA